MELQIENLQKKIRFFIQTSGVLEKSEGRFAPENSRGMWVLSHSSSLKSRLGKLSGQITCLKSCILELRSKTQTEMCSLKNLVFAKVSLMISQMISQSSKLKSCESENMIARRKLAEIEIIQGLFSQDLKTPGVYEKIERMSPLKYSQTMVSN